MFGQIQQNYGFPTNSFNQIPQTNQMEYQHSSFSGQNPINVHNQGNGYVPSMENYYGQKQMNNTSTVQNQFVMGQNNPMQENIIPNQPNQFNMQFNNVAPQMTGVSPHGQTNIMQQAEIQAGGQMNQTSNMGDAGQGSSMYTSYENLPNYGDAVDLNQVVEQMKILFEDKAQWKPKFDAIDNLRILNKYHSKKMNEIIQVFWNYIHESFESQKTCIAKNILMFSTEVFMNAVEVRVQDEVVMALIPQVLNKSISEKSILKKEAENALLNLINNCCYDSSIVTLSKCCFDKIPAICEISLYTLAKMVYNIGDRLPMLRFESLQTLMLALGKIMDSAKKGNMKKWATALCDNMYKRFGRENYQELVLGTVAGQHPELAQYLAKAVEDKKEGKARESGLHDFVKEQRKKNRMSNFGMINGTQKMNPQTILGQPMLEKQLQSETYQFGNNQMGMQNGYSNAGGLFGGQIGFNFPQNY